VALTAILAELGLELKHAQTRIVPCGKEAKGLLPRLGRWVVARESPNRLGLVNLNGIVASPRVYLPRHRARWMLTVKNVGEPYAGEPHARLDGGERKPGDTRPRRATQGASCLPDHPQNPIRLTEIRHSARWGWNVGGGAGLSAAVSGLGDVGERSVAVVS
jgi:hypothetical protein